MLLIGYTGRKFKAIVTGSVEIGTQQWSEGSRDLFTAVNLGTGESKPMVDRRPWPENMKPLGSVDIKPGFAVVEHSTFCGKDMGLRFYIRPENATKLLPDQSSGDFTLAQQAVLFGTRSFKSSYGGKDRYDMTCGSLPSDKYYADFPSVERTQWEAAKTELIGQGYLNARGAITTKGRNAAESIKREPRK